MCCSHLFSEPARRGGTLSRKEKEPSAAGETIIEALTAKNFATVGELRADLAAVLDEDTVKSTLAELLNDCWIEVIR